MSLENFQRQVAKKIKQVRLQRGLLQKDFKGFGYPLRHYQKIESGGLNLTLKTLYKISQALDTDVESFIVQDNKKSTVYKNIFFECPFGIIVWQLKDLSDPLSLCLYEHNRLGATWVYRDLANSLGKSMLEIFPKADEQGLIKIFFEVITSGKPQFVPEVVRHDKAFPLTVFSTKFVKCGTDLGAAIFIDITDEYLTRQELQKQKISLEQFQKLPRSENEQIRDLKKEVNKLLSELGRFAKYNTDR